MFIWRNAAVPNPSLNPKRATAKFNLGHQGLKQASAHESGTYVRLLTPGEDLLAAAK